MADFWDMSEVRQLAADLSAAGQAAAPLARLAVAKSALDLVAEAKYDAPVDTGFLMGSISATVDGLQAEVGPTAEYGLYQEVGTSRMAPQPYLFPALERVTPAFEQAMGQVVDRSLS